MLQYEDQYFGILSPEYKNIRSWIQKYLVEGAEEERQDLDALEEMVRGLHTPTPREKTLKKLLLEDLQYKNR